MEGTISIEWWNPLDPKAEIDEETFKGLFEEALDRVAEQTKEGYTSGQLLSDEYQGWWEITT